MKMLILALLILSQNINVDCSFLSFMSGSFNDFTNFLARTIKSINERLKEFFVRRYVETAKPEADHRIHHKVKPVFSDVSNQAISSHIGEVNVVYDINNVNVDPARILSTPQLAYWHGRDMETHIVQTTDGYFLTLHRITANPYLQANRTVLLHHGLLGSSTDWILLGPTKSLPYILSDAGYDVWITNARGNYYSRGHLSKHLECVDYWNFSWQEMGELDLPAIIDYIRNTKNVTESINFIGHSMGASALLVLLSTIPKYNDYLRVGILLAPLAYMDNIEGPLKVMTGMSEEVIKLMGNGEFLPSRKVPSWLATKYCAGPIIFCSNPLLFISGIHQDRQWNASFTARLLYHVPAGGSTNTLLHYMQVAYNGKFHRFNEPDSEFPLKRITLPIALFSSSDDWLASIPDVLKLYFSLLNPIDHQIIRDRNFTHSDFVWGADSKALVFNKVVEYLERGLTWNMAKQNEI